MSKRVYRSFQSLLCLITFVVVFMSFYFQYALGMEPCPLCLMQRVCALVLGMFCLMGMCLSTLHRARWVAVFQALVALAGIYFAGRQIWLQSLPPDQTPACLPGLGMMLEYFPWQDIVHALLLGAGDCAHVDWQWYGISMAGWSLLYFIGMGIASLVILLLV